MKSKTSSNITQKIKQVVKNFHMLFISVATALTLDGCSALNVQPEVDSLVRVTVKSLCLVPDKQVVDSVVKQVNTVITPNSVSLSCSGVQPVGEIDVGALTLSRTELTVLNDAVKAYCIATPADLTLLDKLNSTIAPITLGISCAT